MEQKPLAYYKEVFNVSDIDDAKKIILTSEGPGAETAVRWEKETPYVVQQIISMLGISQDMLILDYGCGIGRISKEIIKELKCHIIGVDISPDMRRLAVDYVESDRFISVSPEVFDALVMAGLRVDAAFSVWVLQHCEEPVKDILRIQKSLKKDGGFYVLNMERRAVPVISEDRKFFHWDFDGVNIREEVIKRFALVDEGHPDLNAIPNPADAGAFWMNLRN